MVQRDEINKLVDGQRLNVLSVLQVNGMQQNAAGILVFLGEGGIQWQPKWNAYLPGGSIVVFTACPETAFALVNSGYFEGVAHAKGAGDLTVPHDLPYETIDGVDLFPGIIERLIARVIT